MVGKALFVNNRQCVGSIYSFKIAFLEMGLDT